MYRSSSSAKSLPWPTPARCKTESACLNQESATRTHHAQPDLDRPCGAREKGVPVIFCNDARLFHFSYQRDLENCIRNVFGLEGTPVIMSIREKGDKED